MIAAIPEVNPRNRKEKKLNRLAIEKEYKENESSYYDENGRVYDLKSLSETHFVALDGKKKGAR